MNSIDLTPSPFLGLKTENAEEWISSVAFWIRYRKLQSDAAVAAIALLLRGGARQWFQSLESPEKMGVENLIEQFTRRYITNEHNHWKDITAVFDVKQ